MGVVPTKNLTKPAAKNKAKDKELEQSLYATREKIYPREVHGIFAKLRFTGVMVLMGIYYGVPWLNWSGRQAILWDLPNRKFHIFGLTFWPQDLFYLSALLIIAALSLFFFTALAGRLWCGYACPQTVWTEVFLWIERKVEGDRPKQMRLSKSPWNAKKFGLRFTKHGIWIALSLWTGYTFVGYFTPIRDLGLRILIFDVGPWELFWVLFYGFATYGNAGWLREQVCIYMCPYARFQSAMLDKNTLIISYDQKRGDPRGSRRKSDDPKSLGLGDCIDCTICVQACPTGIDIRNGLQYECIGCAACIDACDSVMDKVGYPKGLIRYTTENALESGTTKILRPRIIVYGIVLLTLLTSVIVALSMRIPLDIDVIRDRNALYRETDEGLIENVYSLKILNKDDQAQQYQLRIDSSLSLKLLVDQPDIQVPAGEVAEVTARVQTAPEDMPSQSIGFEFILTSVIDPKISANEPARMVGP
jgi:cytochrome c oxidase accessory protein FixG